MVGFDAEFLPVNSPSKMEKQPEMPMKSMYPLDVAHIIYIYINRERERVCCGESSLLIGKLGKSIYARKINQRSLLKSSIYR